MRTRAENEARDQRIVTGAVLTQLREKLTAATNAVEFAKGRSSGDLERRTAAAWQKIVEAVEGGLLDKPEPEPAASIRDVHTEEIATYVRGVVQEAHRSERARVLIYSRTPYSAALETIATERAAALELLRDAIDNGLLTRLAVDRFATDPATEAFVDAADAERTAQRDEYVNSATEQAVRPIGHVDYAEADDVREIEREMAIEAGDDSETDRQIAEDDARFERSMWLANQAAKDAEAQDDAWSATEQFEHDQACEARIDAADAESGV